MAAQPKVNYTEEMVTRMIDEYQAGTDIETIAESLGKTVRSVRSKLVREGVYVAQPKAVRSKRPEGPTKKELLRDLEAVAPFAVDGFMGATKEAISALLAHLSEASGPDEVSEDTDEVSEDTDEVSEDTDEVSEDTDEVDEVSEDTQPSVE